MMFMPGQEAAGAARSVRGCCCCVCSGRAGLPSWARSCQGCVHALLTCLLPS